MDDYSKHSSSCTKFAKCRTINGVLTPVGKCNCGVEPAACSCSVNGVPRVNFPGNCPLHRTRED